MNPPRQYRMQSNIFNNDAMPAYNEHQNRRGIQSGVSQANRSNIGDVNPDRLDKMQLQQDERIEYQQVLRNIANEDRNEKEDALRRKLLAQQELRACYENQMNEKKMVKDRQRMENDQYANEYGAHLEHQAHQRGGAQVHQSLRASGGPAMDNKSQLQNQENNFTGLQIGEVQSQTRYQKNNDAHSYHAMLDQQIALKKDAQLVKKAEEARVTQDAIDHQLFLQQKTDAEKQRNMNGGFGRDTGNRRNDMQGIEGRDAYSQIKNKYGNHSGGYNILTGN